MNWDILIYVLILDVTISPEQTGGCKYYPNIFQNYHKLYGCVAFALDAFLFIIAVLSLSFLLT